MTPKRIDLNDYIRTGEGANGLSFSHRTNPDIMLKLYFRNFEAAEQELALARKVYDMGIPTPEPGDLVTDGERVGIRFKRLEGKKSYSRATGDDPEHAEEYAREFARMCQKLHAIHVDTNQFESVKARLFHMLDDNPFFTPEQKQKLHDFITAAPDADTAIHGDLQFSNAVFTEQDGLRQSYFIDLGDFCYGYPMFDIGMVYLCCCLNDEAWTKEVYHMSNATAARFWEAFAQEYFISPNCPLPQYGPQADMDQIMRDVRIYAGLKTIMIERDTHCPMPQFRAMLEGTIY